MILITHIDPGWIIAQWILLFKLKLSKLLVDTYATRMIYLQLRQFKEESSAKQK
jgi:hypothetical protein